ncbi:Lipase [Popillia japonica]|uniref:Lipase n=1 Tax=Popillia japonica TaxID=7064 RepID=A0AAW1K4M5_POPJA
MLLHIILGSLLAVSAYGQVQDGDVRFFLTNAHMRMREFSTSGISALSSEKGNNCVVKVISHGWVDDFTSSWYEPTYTNYLSRDVCNVIAMDWSRHASGLYSTAVSRLPAVGRLAAEMILNFSDVHNIPLSNFHLIGHSLGAHLFGFAGKHIIELRGQRVGRITGLDPAGPSYEGNPPNNRISADDADFVDIMHTDGGGLGMRASVGDVDYFPNGGTSRQNGCGLLQIGCSHNRAPPYFYESIISSGFVTARCDSESDFNNGRCNNNLRTVMGENVDLNARGNYYLRTASGAPYGLGTL